jgi:hypothetical protein
LWIPGGDEPSKEQERLERFAKLAMRDAAKGPLDSSEDMKAMRQSRRSSAFTKQAYGGFSGDVSLSMSRPNDPLWYWRQNNLPFDYTKDEDSTRIREWCRLIYVTHPVIGSCIDIFSSWPMTGMHLEARNDDQKSFYEDHFFNDLEVEEYYQEVLKEYFLIGEAFPLGQFNETLGVWDDDELINPNDIKVIKTPFSKTPRYEMKIPETIRHILQDNNEETEWEARKLRQSYPELVRYAQTDKHMPVSNVLLKQLANKADTFHDRGLSILMRAFRSIHQEEMLNSAVDSIASRLYTPLILVKLGASASDLGTDAPFIPTEEDLLEFEGKLDAALAADFRVLTSHFATQIESVFGREIMSDFSGDFDRVTARQLQAFGLSETMLTGSSQGETYAADALNRDIVSVKLLKAQKLIKRLYEDRAYIVAEAQGHYDYDERGGKRYVKMEEVLEVDEETGERKIVEQPKLLIPEMKFDVLNLQDQDQERQFVEALRASGVPISNQTRLTNVAIDLDEEYEKVKNEAIRLAVETQETRKELFLELRRKNLPIAQDLMDDFQPKVLNADDIQEQEAADEGMPLENMVMDPPGDSAAMVPTQEDEAMGEDSENAPPGTPAQADPAAGQSAMVIPFPSRPPESSEQMDTMPKASKLYKLAKVEIVEPEKHEPMISGPKLRKRANLDPDIPMNEQGF